MKALAVTDFTNLKDTDNAGFFHQSILCTIKELFPEQQDKSEQRAGPTCMQIFLSERTCTDKP